jgi:exodeoxyribonuclease V alpha subunit
MSTFTESFERPQDPYDRRLALGASGLLRAANVADVLSAADVHVATRIAQLAGEPDDRVRLAVAMAVRGIRSGSVCIDLAQARATLLLADPGGDWPVLPDWRDAVRASPLVGAGRPLQWEFDLLYLDRYRTQEQQVRDDLRDRRAQPPPVVDRVALADGLDRLFAGGDPGQRHAAELAATGWTTVIGGGPGTGKTTTVARVLALLMGQPGARPRVAMAAPTGKAAARLQAAVQAQAVALSPADRHDLPTLTASTLHRLLGWLPGRSQRFRHDRDNRLPFDVVVVDETSMVSLTMMARLLEAVRPDARLILVGDPDQLASVEAGAVLADLVAGLTAAPAAPPATGSATGPATESATGSGAGPGAVPPGPPAIASARADEVALLDRTWRFGGDIAELAAAVRAGDADAALAVLARPGADVALIAPEDTAGAGAAVDAAVRPDVVGTAAAVRAAADAGEAQEALRRLDGHRVLCAHRSGPRGVTQWTYRIENWLAAEDLLPPHRLWYPGRPVLVTANDYTLRLFNGDVGVAVLTGGQLRVSFSQHGRIVDYAPGRLADVQTVHAMTVHRSQGSQFDRVTVVLPEADSPLCTRELLYTALTRAQTRVRLIGTEAEVRAAVARPAARASGLRLRMAGG